MLARSFRRVLLIELALFVSLGWGLAHYAAWSALQVAALVLGVALAIRALGVAAALALAARSDGPTPPAFRIGFAAWLRLYLAELGAYILLFNLYQPFAPLFVGTEKLRPLPPGRLPVLLLHGYVCNRGFMLPLRRYLQAQDVSAYSHDLEPPLAGIDSYCGALAQRIEEICAATGSSRLVIVAYSMGGLAARAYLRKHGAARVAALITLGTPHHGTALARLGAGENASQMVPGSAWLRLLNQHPIAIPVVSVFSHQDNIVSPRDSAALAGARLVELHGVGHLTMAFSRRVREIALREISAAS